MKLPRSILAGAVVAPMFLTASVTRAQDVQYETVTKIEFPGAMGTMVRLAAKLGGGSTETVETTYIKGGKMRTDAGQKSSSIVDYENKRMLFLDHEAKTYTSVTFDEMLATAKQSAEAMKTGADKRTTSGGDGSQKQMTFRFNVDDGNDRQRIAGYDASRFFLTMEMEGEYVPDSSTQREKAGTLVVLTDMYASKDVPAYKALSAFRDASAAQYAAAGSALTEGFAAAFADDPQVKVAFERSAAEAQKIEGMAVKSVVMMVVVAPEKKFDRALALAPKAAGQGVAQRAARSGLGRLRAAAAGAAAGAAGISTQGSSSDQAAAQQQDQPQVTMLTVTSELRNVRTASLDAKLFEVPAGYREVKAGGE